MIFQKDIAQPTYDELLKAFEERLETSQTEDGIHSFTMPLRLKLDIREGMMVNFKANINLRKKGLITDFKLHINLIRFHIFSLILGLAFAAIYYYIEGVVGAVILGIIGYTGLILAFRSRIRKSLEIYATQLIKDLKKNE